MRVTRGWRIGAGVMLAAGLWALPAAQAQEARKPAVCFVSRDWQLYLGGAEMRRNLMRLDREGYRIAHYPFEELNSLPVETIDPFDVIVILNAPQLDYYGTQELKPVTLKQYAEMRKLLKAGGGLLIFPEPHEWSMKALWPLFEPYGAAPLTGCFADPDPKLAAWGGVGMAYSTNTAKSPLTAGVRGCWYPVGGKTGGKFDFDTLRNANTMPFAVDKSWTVLLGTADTTQYASYGYSDSKFLSQPQFNQPPGSPAPLVAVREGVEGAGRMAICGINAVYSNFVAGNTAYDGACTGKGLEGKPSDLDTLLMNVLNWLADPSMKAGRETIPASLQDTFRLEPFTYAPPLKNIDKSGPLAANPDQFHGVVGVRSTYSGGKSTVAEYAKVARELGLDYLAFLEDYNTLKPEEFDRFKEECVKNSDDKLIVLPGIRIENNLGIHFFGFKWNMLLPQPSCLAPGTRQLNQKDGGEYLWMVKNAAREAFASGNYRLQGVEPSGVPSSNYNVLNPFVSIYTYQDGKLSDTDLNTYLKCAGRTEWVSPIAVHLIDSAAQLRQEWQAGQFQTVWLRNAGEGLEGFKRDIAERYGNYPPVSYVTNGPVIEEWRSSNADFAGGWWDWTWYRWFVKMAVSSEGGLKEIRVMNGSRLYQRYLPGGAKRFEQVIRLNHCDMHNLILIVTDNNGRQAISDEEWDKNQLWQLTWCSDRNNMTGYSGQPDPKTPWGSTTGDVPNPWSMEKGGFRETLEVWINYFVSRIPGFDGNPMCVASVSPAPTTSNGTEWESDLSRDIGRLLNSPDVAIQTASCRLMYPYSVPPQGGPARMGPLEPMKLFNADLSYTTFAHPDHLPVPVLLQGKAKLLRDMTFPTNLPSLGLEIITMNADKPEGGYKAFAILHSQTGDHTGVISYEQGAPTPQYWGALDHGAYISMYPSKFGAVTVISLTDGLSYRYSNHHANVGFDLRGKTAKAGQEFSYRMLVVTGSFDEAWSNDLIESFRQQYGIAEKGKVAYQVALEQGKIADQEYILTVDGQGRGFAGEITLPPGLPITLPIEVTNLNDKWEAVLYDRAARRLRPLGIVDNTAYCHRTPDERGGKLFIGHPFTLDNPNLRLSVVQTGERELTLQIHNPTDQEAQVKVTRNPAFDLVTAPDFSVTVPAGATVEREISGP